MGVTVLIIAAVLILIVFTCTLWSASNANRSVLLDTTLPLGEMQNEEVKKIVRRFRRDVLLLAGVFLLLVIPMVFVQDLVSLSIFFFFAWIILLLLLEDRILGRHSKALRKLKAEKGWVTGPKRIISIDTEVARFKDKMPVSKWWMLPAIVVSCIPLLLSLLRKENWPALLIAASPIFVQGVFLLLRTFTEKARSTAYTDNTDVNRACHYLAQRQWSLHWTIQSALAAGCSLILCFLYQNPSLNHILSPVLIGALTLFFVWDMFAVHQRVRNGQNRLLEAAAAPITADEDEFWKNGCYNNPYDPRATVEKRFGVGWTANLGNAKGKLSAYGALGFAAIIVGGILTMFIVTDATPFRLTVKDDTVSISAAMYGIEFSVSDLSEVMLSDDLPNPSVRTNGVGTAGYALGHFTVNHSKALLYVYSDSPLCLILTLPDKTVYFTGQTPEETRAAYEAVKGAVPSA